VLIECILITGYSVAINKFETWKHKFVTVAVAAVAAAAGAVAATAAVVNCVVTHNVDCKDISLHCLPEPIC
jgi:hypothetical protein